jgi:Uma2 family endonuclease
MIAETRLQLATVQEYLAAEECADEKHEYVGGYVYQRAVTNALHNIIAGAFVGLMYVALRGRKFQAWDSNTKVRLRMATHTRFYYPDGMVVCEANPGREVYQDRPVVLAEVISESTRRIDEMEKREAYLTIPELSAYLLIESDSACVTVHRRTDGGFVAEQYEGLDAIVPLDSISAKLSLQELYERVDFSAETELEVE